MSIKDYFETEKIETEFSGLEEGEKWAEEEVKRIYADTMIDFPKLPQAIEDYYKSIPNGLQHLAHTLPPQDKLIESVYYNFFGAFNKTKATSLERMMARIYIKKMDEVAKAYKARQRGLQQLKAHIINKTRVRLEWGDIIINWRAQKVVERSLSNTNAKLQRILRINAAIKELRENHGVNF